MWLIKVFQDWSRYIKAHLGYKGLSCLFGNLWCCLGLYMRAWPKLRALLSLIVTFKRSLVLFGTYQDYSEIIKAHLDSLSCINICYNCKTEPTRLKRYHKGSIKFILAHLKLLNFYGLLELNSVQHKIPLCFF